MSKHNLWLGGWYNYALSLSGPSACVVPARLLYDCCHVTNSYVFRFPLIPPASGQRLNFIIKFCSVLFKCWMSDYGYVLQISAFILLPKSKNLSYKLYYIMCIMSRLIWIYSVCLFSFVVFGAYARMCLMQLLDRPCRLNI